MKKDNFNTKAFCSLWFEKNLIKSTFKIKG